MTKTDAGQLSGHPAGDYGRGGEYLLMSSDPTRNVDPSEDTGTTSTRGGVDPSEGPGSGVDPSEGTTSTYSRVDPSEGPGGVDPSEDTGLIGPDPWDD